MDMEEEPLELGPNTEFLQALHLSPDIHDKDVRGILMPMILSAIYDDNPVLSLDKIWIAVEDNDGHTYLDPLDVLGHLIACPRQGADDFMYFLGAHFSPKEVILAMQEYVERMKIGFHEDNAEENQLAPAAQLANVALVYNVSIFRLVLKKKSPYETIFPLLSELTSVVNLVGGRAAKVDGRNLIREISNLASSTHRWVVRSSNKHPEDIQNTNDLLGKLIDTSIQSCASCIQSSLAARSFEAHFPRLVVTSYVSPDWNNGQAVIFSAMKILVILGIEPEIIWNPPTISNLVYLAHSPHPLADPLQLLNKILPVLISSLQMNVALDECLYLLLDCLTRMSAAVDLPDEVVIPLCDTLPALASGHPDAFIRHITFRLLSLVLALSSPPLRLQILRELTSELSPPQMRASAIGLVKEAMMEALGSPAAKGANIFASPLLLQAFGPILFRTSPPYFFSSIHSLDDIRESLEPARLVECLSLYYVLLQRDTENKTGVRDRDQISSVKSSLLKPLSLFLEQNERTVVQLIALRVSLDRVDDALEKIEKS
ncbi:hypothetical protein SERLA73DRAFT_174762 [Serpula lacrymans var. lacrymans S7.3]|uniref:Uncharacterized protein n=2 Tax=Serpula lacrymans var. lacrymans TaxID=341189 RepID=F8PKI5_SERL3|nr:uncharacterized protein SERLADRAFT_456411 [Serpula lacrymans var. lacrymans S7.9]EGO03319.1 hypothetical protein SERLA73DRAFT_174762 [Serpula lacrymans var. lacrymans S7.3]EGO29094.1 hypothetical protein SERLADRAFT_456411 [Serpula lacrymans var. lacrymans S7.9]